MSEFFVGLDLGQAQDPSAMAILERKTTPEEDPKPPDTSTTRLQNVLKPDPDAMQRFLHGEDFHKPPQQREQYYACRRLHRWELGTPYTKITEDMVKTFSVPPLRDSNLIVDLTGVGQAVVDMLTQAKPKAQIRPVLITGGHGSSVHGSGWHVAKKELVGALRATFHRFSIVPSLPQAAILAKELSTFSSKITAAGNETFEAWRERDHDDLVLATAIALWVAERGLRRFWAA